MAGADDVFVLSLSALFGNIGVALTGFGMAIVYLFVWQIASLAGYAGDFKFAVFIQAIALFSAQPLLLYKADIRQHASRRMLRYFIPITILATPLGQITGDRVSTELVEAIGGVLVTFVAVFEVYQKRKFFASWFTRCWPATKEEVSDKRELQETTDSTVQYSDAAPQVTFADCYDFGKEQLGTGNYSVVRIATRKSDLAKYAIKVVDKPRLLDEELDKLKDEIGLMREMVHPNIVRLYEVFDEPTKLFMVTELMPGGDLFSHITGSSYLSEGRSRFICKSILQALDFLHSRKIAHRDLKPENLLLASDHQDAAVKIADFGFAARADGSLKTMCGTPAYVAPEILKSIPYGVDVDCWSMGVTCFVMMAGYLPFRGEDDEAVRNAIKKGHFVFEDEFWNSVSKEAKSFVTGLLQVDPRNRLTASAALQHKWFSSPVSLASEDGSNVPVFFMIGSQRSGSNWLRTMLDEREDLVGPHPPHVMRDFTPLLEKFGDLGEEHKFRVLVDHVATFVECNQVPWTDKHGSKVNFPRGLLFGAASASVERMKESRLASNNTNAIESKLYLLSVFDAIMNHYTKVNGKRMWMCKSMGMSKFHDELLEFYGEKRLRYIYLVRDPRDVAMSFMKTPVGDCHYYAIAKKWTNLQGHALRILQETPELIHKVHYEAILKNKTETVKGIYEFIGERRFGGIKRQASVMFMNATEDLIDGAKSGREAQKARHLSYQFQNLGRGESFAALQVQKWRHPVDGLCADDLQLVESVTADTMKRFGYEPHLVGKSTKATIFTSEDLEKFDQLNKEGIKKMNDDLKVENPGDFERRRVQAEVLSFEPNLLSSWTDEADSESSTSEMFVPFLTPEALLGRLESVPTKTATLKNGSITIRYAVSSQRGYYPHEHDKPNQDAFTTKTFLVSSDGVDKKHVHWFSCFDGHGPDGHLCAAKAADSLPSIFTGLTANGSSTIEGLEQAHSKVHEELLGDDSIRDDQSGSTATTVLLHEDGKCTISNVGDSTCILGSWQRPNVWKARRLCEEHTPKRREEFDRIVRAGGIVMTVDQHDGLAPMTTSWESSDLPPRVWSSANDKFPGCGFTRSLGDSIAHTLGVTARPEISEYQLEATDRFMLIVSDGITEFMSNEECIDIVKQYPRNPSAAAQALIAESTERWMKRGDYLDDITCIVLDFDDNSLAGGSYDVESGEVISNGNDNTDVTNQASNDMSDNMKPLSFRARFWTLLAGAASGFLGGLCGIRGPPLILYFLHLPAGIVFSKKTQRATGAAITATNVAMRIAYYLVNTFAFDGDDNFEKDDWSLYVSVVVCSVLGVYVGSKLFEVMKDSKDTIRGILTIFLVLCGISLLLSSFADL